MNRNSFVETAINYMVQAIIAFLAILASINIAYSYLLAASRLSGLTEIHGLLAGMDVPLMYLALAIWLFSQMKMVKLIYESKGLLTVNSVDYDSKWLGVIYPAIYIFGISIVLIVVSVPAFILGAALNLVVAEVVSQAIVLIFTLLGYILFFLKKGSTEPPWAKNSAEDA